MNPPLLSDYLDYLQSIRGTAASTRKEYGYDLLHMLRFLVYRKSDRPIDDEFESTDLSICDEKFHRSITLRDLHAFLSYLDRDKDNAAAARSRKISAMRSYFSYLTDIIRVIDQNPTGGLESPKKKMRHPVYLTLDESIRLLNQIQQVKNETLRARDYCITLLFLTCGLRLSELAQINIDSMKGDTLTVIGKGNKERTVYLTPSTIEAISDWMRVRPVIDGELALFVSTQNRRMTNRAIQYRIEKHLQDAGFDTTLYTTHKLRHTAATLMYKHGQVDIRTLQQVLGHVSVATTQIYTHTDDEQLRDAVIKNPLSNFH